MPELPEVETIVRSLCEGGRGGSPLPGMKVSAVRLLWERSLELPTPVELSQLLLGLFVADVNRRGKFIDISFHPQNHQPGLHLLFHLRMSGDLCVVAKSEADPPHSRFLLYFDGGERLVFNDARKFGRIWLTPHPENVFARLGPEPWDPILSEGEFYSRLHRYHRQIKPLLLDQSFLAGLGNIYTDEALFKAGLHPRQLADSLRLDQAGKLLQAIRQVLVEGIDRQGSSIDWAYQGGNFQNCFCVYQRQGEHCPVCGAIIQRIVLGQRGTHFCPVCQPAA